MKRDSSFEKKKEKEKSLRFKSNDYTRISSQRYRYFNITAAIIQIIAEYHFSKIRNILLGRQHSFECCTTTRSIPQHICVYISAIVCN